MTTTPTRPAPLDLAASRRETCETCEGRGTVRRPHTRAESVACPACDGTGTVAGPEPVVEV